MSFIYKRRLFCNNIDGMCFFTPTGPQNEHRNGALPYTAMFNSSVIEIYDPVHKILEKNLFRPIKQIISCDNHLFILFADGNLSEVLYNAGNIELVSLIYIDEVGTNTFLRADGGVMYVHYDRFKFGIHVFARRAAGTLNKSAVLDNVDLTSSRRVKTGLHMFHEIDTNLNNVKDVVLIDDLIYFLYSADLNSMSVLIVDLCSFAVLRDVSVDSTAFKLYRLNDTHVVVLSERTVYFLWVDSVVFTYCVPFDELADQNGTAGAFEGARLFNTAEAAVNDSIFIFNGDHKIYRLHICYAGQHIQSVSTGVQRSFHQYESIRRVFEANHFLFLVLEDRTALLLEPQFSAVPKIKKNVPLSEVDDNIDLYNTRVQIDQPAEAEETANDNIDLYNTRVDQPAEDTANDNIDLYNTRVDQPAEAEEVERQIKTYSLIKTHHSFGNIKYVFECDTGTNGEYLIVTDRLIQYFDVFTFKFTRNHRIGGYKQLMKANDLFVLTNETSSSFFRWIDGKIVKYDGLLKDNQKERSVEVVMDEYVKGGDEYVKGGDECVKGKDEHLGGDEHLGKDEKDECVKGRDEHPQINKEHEFENKRAKIARAVQAKTENTEYITDQETLALFYFQNRLFQVTRAFINVLNERKMPINAETAKENGTLLFVKTGGSLKAYPLVDLINGTMTCALSFENVECFSANGPLLLLCDSLDGVSRLQLFRGEEMLFCTRLYDFCDILNNGGAENELDATAADAFRIDECLVYQNNDVFSVLLKSAHVIALYEGFARADHLPYFVKRRNLISFYRHALHYTRNFVFIKNNFVILTCDNRVQRTTNSFECVVEDADAIYGISKRNIVEFSANPAGCVQRVHDIKNIDRIIKDETNGVYVLTFLPRAFETSSTCNAKDNEDTPCEERQELVTCNAKDNEDTPCEERQELVMCTLSLARLSIFRLPKNELVTDLKIMSLCDSNGDHNDFVVVVLSQRTSNEILRGRILVFEVIDVISDTADRKTKKALKLLGSERTKGPISCCAAVRGRIAVSLATRLMVYEFDRNTGIVAIAFYDLYMYAVSLAVIKNYIVVGDIMMGLHFVYFQSEPVKLHLLSKSGRVANLGSLDFFNAGDRLFITGIDKTGEVQIFSFSPGNLYSNEGEKLVKRQQFETYAHFQSIRTNTYRSYASFFSSQNFFVTLSYTQKDYGKIHDVLKCYREIKSFWGVSLRYQHQEVCYKKCVHTDLLLNFFNEPVKYQKDVCGRVGHDYEEILHLIEDFLKL
ncbi:mRNA cleavage and polyadenylation factor II complex, subunit CFT1 (CPSF subunit) [Trachipleistophora hominis]|uniref:mRNA cleavage and polyadenylation factor II complex, subunit CFT1 (CPSF subunit) n=1 Tax=Trachipleistophora hominis TaxID=72359 RepID=L7JVW0_TRAHO|nr:mRNA cleavage and polyadenylation factor II complex, subunit CFT1 (CPSF subunit) [Trachipleistophora hominis]